MSTPTYDLIETTTLASAASSVTFSSITQDYRDLVLVCNIPPAAAFVFTQLRFNGDSGTVYSVVDMDAQTGGFSSGSATLNKLELDGFNTSTSRSTYLILNIMDYSATDKHTSVLSKAGSSQGRVQFAAGRYASTSAITSITIEDFGSGGNMPSGSIFTIYGIAS